jgi:hypothetical protein
LHTIDTYKNENEELKSELIKSQLQEKTLNMLISNQTKLLDQYNNN